MKMIYKGYSPLKYLIIMIKDISEIHFLTIYKYIEKIQ